MCHKCIWYSFRFKKVESKIVDGSSDNTKIVDIIVEEQPTGEISLGAGVGTDGSTIGFAISENNYLGKGIGLNSNVTISTDTFKGLFSVSNPNFNNSSGISSIGNFKNS